MRERISPRSGARNPKDGVTCSWRKVSARASNVLVVTLGGDIVKRLGLARGLRCIVERDRLAGQMFLRVARDEGWKPAWKDGCACINVPLDDVALTLTEKKPAQAVHHHWDEQAGELVLRLPPWACPPVRITPAPGKERAA